MKQCITMFVLLAGAIGLQAQSPWTTTTFVAVPLTATNQTSAAVVLQRSAATRDSYSAGKLTVTGVGLTTATFSVLGSADNGATYNVLATEPCSTPGTFATSQTVTASPSCYEVNTSSLFAVKFATSGTFTATSISIVLTVNPNAQITRNGGGGGGGSGVESINGDTGAFTFGAGSSCTGTSCTFPGTGGGAVSSVSNSDGSLTVTPTTGAVGASINTAHANTYTATQTFPAASIPNATLTNSSATVNGVNCALGGTCNTPLICGGGASNCVLQQINPAPCAATTSLASSITATQTTIPLVSTACLIAPLIIANSAVSAFDFSACTGISGNTLTGCTRGLYTATPGTGVPVPASGSFSAQVTNAYAFSSTVVPYFYTLQNGAVGYGGSVNAMTPNQVNYGGLALFQDGISVTGNALFVNGLTVGSLPGVPTPSANFNSENFVEVARYLNGSGVPANDEWTGTVVLGTGENPTSTWTFAHSGTSGAIAVSVPALQDTSQTGSTQCAQFTATGLLQGTGTPTCGGVPLTYTYIKAATSSAGAAFTSGFTVYDNNAPQPGSVNTGASALGYLLFNASPTASQFAETTLTMPPFWTSTSLYLNLFSTSTTGNAVMDVQVVCVPTGTALTTTYSPTFSTAVTSTTAVSSTASGAVQSAIISNIAAPGSNGCPASPTVPTELTIRVFADSTDTVPVSLLGATLVIGRSQ
jgi:hypothetical protein